MLGSREQSKVRDMVNPRAWTQVVVRVTASFSETKTNTTRPMVSKALTVYPRIK
jgi:hypothetical protein